nr:Fic family protein [Romeria gracilis]
MSNLDIKAFISRDQQEVAGYAAVMETVFQAWQQIPITENYIRQLHRDLLIYSEKDDWHRGQYKTSSNRVAAFDADGNQVGIVFETASPFETPRLMTELVTWFEAEKQAEILHPLLIIGIFIVVFLEIHPFQDGNGRLSRVLTTLLLLQAGYTYVPYSSLESVIEQSKEGYYIALRQTQRTIRSDAPLWEPWLVFFLRALQQQMQRLRKKAERESLLLADLSEISAQILEHVKDHGRITIGEAVTLTGVSRNTLKLHFRRLVANGHLKLHGQGRGAWYGF